MIDKYNLGEEKCHRNGLLFEYFLVQQMFQKRKAYIFNRAWQNIDKHKIYELARIIHIAF